jgi:hypothetical protein
VFVLGGREPNGSAIATLDSAQGALERARKNLDRVIGPGIDLVVSDPDLAEDLLTEAHAALEVADRANVPESTIGPLRTRIVGALDRLYGMVDVASSGLFAFPEDPAVDLEAVVRGPDGAPFVLDAATATVYRIDIEGQKATAIFREGNKAAGATQAAPRLLGVGGRDLLMVDAKNVVWRWRPANSTGKGTITRVRVSGATEWGDDVIAIGTFIRDPEANLYNFYVIDPSAQQVLRYSPAADGSGFPAQPNQWLSSPRDVSGITAMYIDGDIWLADTGQMLRVVNGNSAGWSASAPGDAILRDEPVYRLVASGAERRTGTIYGFDADNERVVALSKANGSFIAQYRLAAGASGWTDLRDWYVEAGLEGEPDELIWISATGLHRVLLQPTNPNPGASPTPGAATDAAGGSGTPDADP